MQVFISYKSEYREFARQVKEAIESWGFSTWFDVDNIPKGGYFRHEIQKGLESSDIVLGIVTPEALASREVQAEWDFAFSAAFSGEKEKRFLLLLHQEASLPYHLGGVQYIDTSKNPELGIQQLEQALKSGDISQQKIVATPKPEKVVKALNKTQLDNRSAMLDKVQTYWVEGVLHNALGESGSLAIGLNSSTDAVLKHRDYEDYQFPENSLDIHQLFKDMQSELLILGAPGSGKTILLLQLAEKLIAEASENDKLPIPVLFNLSSWAAKRQSLRDWLIDELNIKYQIPKKIAKKWIEHEKLLLLLDGLDEVVEEHRAACLDAINTFREDYRSVDMAICSRIAEYEGLTNKLDLQGAITLQPLSDEQVADYLADDAYTTLRETMAKDETLQDIAEVPFLLNTMAYAYGDANPVMLTLADDETRTNHLFENYVEKRIQADTFDSLYTPKETRHYLKCLAGMMVDKGETTFAIESIEPIVIERWWGRLAFRLLFGAIIILIVGMITFILYWGWQGVSSAFMPSIGLGAYIGFSLVFDYLKQTHQLKRAFRINLLPIGLIVIFVLLPELGRNDPDSVIGVTIFVMVMIFIGFFLSFSSQTISYQRRWSFISALKYGVAGSLIFIVVIIILFFLLMFMWSVWFGVLLVNEIPLTLLESITNISIRSVSSIWLLLSPIFIVLGGFRTKRTITRIRPNEGFIRTLRSSAIITILVGVSLQLFVWIFVIGGQYNNIQFAVNLPVPFIWVIFGGSAISRHIATRLVLGWQGHIPKWRYDKFLDYAANNLHILRKVGGSYIFRHRYLLEYFAGRELK